jgi:hypothetical protein
MKNTTKAKIKQNTIQFHTGVKCLVDRKIGSINILSNQEMAEEQPKLKNVRNGKIRP